MIGSNTNPNIFENFLLTVIDQKKTAIDQKKKVIEQKKKVIEQKKKGEEPDEDECEDLAIVDGRQPLFMV